MKCRDCRFSEGEARRLGDGWVLVLWCLAKGGRALEACENFAPMEGGDDDA